MISTANVIYYSVIYWLYDCMLILTAMACFVHHIYLVISSLSVWWQGCFSVSESDRPYSLRWVWWLVFHLIGPTDRPYSLRWVLWLVFHLIGPTDRPSSTCWPGRPYWLSTLTLNGGGFSSIIKRLNSTLTSVTVHFHQSMAVLTQHSDLNGRPVSPTTRPNLICWP